MKRKGSGICPTWPVAMVRLAIETACMNNIIYYCHLISCTRDGMGFLASYLYYLYLYRLAMATVVAVAAGVTLVGLYYHSKPQQWQRRCMENLILTCRTWMKPLIMVLPPQLAHGHTPPPTKRCRVSAITHLSLVCRGTLGHTLFFNSPI